MKLNKITATLFALGMVLPAFAENFTVNEFRVEGEQHTSEATVRSLLPLKVGDTFTDEKGEELIQRLYATGFYENVLLEQNGNMLIITVKERPIISELTVKGAKVLPNDAIVKQMATVKASNASNDADLVASKKGEQSYDEKLQEYETQAAYNTAQALASSGLGKGDFFSQEALVRALRALDGAYKEQGKNNAKITPKVQELSHNRVAVTVNVEEGETTRMNALNFEGNEAFSDYRLSRIVGLTDGTIFSWATKSNVFSWEKFSRDKARLEAFYHEHGYFDFQVDYNDVERQFNEDKTKESVTIKLHEGKKFYWGNIRIVGDTKDVPRETLEKHLKKLKAGRLSNMDSLQAAMALIHQDLQSAGYANAKVTSETVRREENGKNIADISIVVAPGNRVAVRSIKISGNNKTRDEVIRREMRQMEGATYDQSKLARSSERLRQLGYFDDVKILTNPFQKMTNKLI